jgi:hypothetical protein
MFDNGGCRNPVDSRGFEVTRSVVADRKDHESHHPEAELVTFTLSGRAVEMCLDDGVSLVFDGDDLRAALEVAP